MNDPRVRTLGLIVVILAIALFVLRVAPDVLVALMAGAVLWHLLDTWITGERLRWLEQEAEVERRWQLEEAPEGEGVGQDLEPR